MDEKFITAALINYNSKASHLLASYVPWLLLIIDDAFPNTYYVVGWSFKSAARKKSPPPPLSLTHL